MGFFSFYQLFPILFLGIFALIMGLVFTSFVRAGRENRKNDNSPRLTCEATVVTKRTYVWGDHSRTNYFATFQFPSGDRLELQVPPQRIRLPGGGRPGQTHIPGHPVPGL